MSKNIVICCDGTNNEFAQDRTNVIKLYYTLEQNPGQATYYHPGLGTMEATAALTPFAKAVTKGLGLAMGYGLSRDLRDAYTYLMNHYEEHDNVYVFGFSRGAYTARALCSLLKMYGLIRAGNDALVPYAVRMMMNIHKLAERRGKGELTTEDKTAQAKYFQLAEDFSSTMCRTGVRPYFVGVWDTVSSVGWKDHPVKLPYTANNPDIQIGRHAIAIDEKRAFFRTNRWMPPKDPKVEFGPKDCLQVWFAGVHCDVGGGYPEAKSGLSKIALAWMLGEAKAAGLQVDPDREKKVLGLSGGGFVPENADGDAHESLAGAWKVAEWIRKPHYDAATGKTEMRANRGRRRTIPAGSMVHESVRRRHGGAYWKAAGVPEDAVWVSTRRNEASGSSA
jgi:uncharacterized protein (DUF2235 family)